jgi:putative membrane-bound dehydrogenase-like protein
MRWKWAVALVWCSAVSEFCFAQTAANVKSGIQAGAAMVDITPTIFPVIVNGMMEERTATGAHDALMSRALVLDDGKTRIGIIVVDSLMLTREMLDLVKSDASQQTGIPVDRMLISSTHTHSAPSAMPCLGSRTDPEYAAFLPQQIVRSIVQANERRIPVQIGWAVTTADRHNHCRRWIFRSDRRTMTDPFGQHNVLAHMHPGYESPNHIGPSGPADTDLTLLSIQTTDGKPLAVLANFAMHYFGSPLVSGDFCGRFGQVLAKQIGADTGQPSFVGIMSQGTSGDSMWFDYSRPANKATLDNYTQQVAEIAAAAYRTISYRSDLTLAMAEATLKLKRRVPDEARLQWARELTTQVGDRLPRGLPEVYAFEQLRLHENPTAELKLQAIRIGDFGITAIPNEVFGITGIKLKNRSPLPTTINIELANGAEGYIPPPEQHRLGGYTTWPARSAGLEVQAEPQIVEMLTQLLEQAADRQRWPDIDDEHDYSRAVAASKPKAYWRLGEIECQQTPELAGNHVSLVADATGTHPAIYEEGVAFYLPGPAGMGLQQGRRGNRAAHFAGGRVVANVAGLESFYSVEFWVWNGYPNSDRAVTGYLFSRGPEGDADVAGDHLGIGGSYLNRGWDGKLLVFNGNRRDEALVGTSVLQPRTWNHVVFVRQYDHVTVYLNGNPKPEIDGDLEPTFAKDCQQIFLGGRSDRLFGLEGRLDEVALYTGALTVEEVASHFEVAGASPERSDVSHSALQKSDAQGARANSLPVQLESNPHPASGHLLPAREKRGDRETLEQAPQINEVVARPDSLPMSPSESMKVTHVREGYELQLVAAEPLVVDPVAIDWGPDGKLWVAEMADYPSGMDNNGKPGGRVRFLEDSDSDGQYDRSTVFLEDVSFPTGVMAWGNGVLVTAAPELFYAQDTDGDGRADVRRTLYSGFLEGNQQLRVNGLRWGLDNWIHCASGSHHAGYGADSQILSHGLQQKFVVGSRDFRIRPHEGLIDPQSGPSQFGRNRDAWGNWFGEQNSYPLWHYVLEDHYIRRNPGYAPPDPRRLLTPSNPPVYAAATPEKRFHSFDQAGRFTSACSGMVYLDDKLFDETPATTESSGDLPVQHVFTCEPFSNLVQHNLLIDEGMTFRLDRDPAEVNAATDFFASEDRWCRPVMVRTGPDGALWVVDMYRYMIEHPHWLPKEGQDELRPFFRSGDDRGRIYRIVREVNLNKSESTALVSPRLDQFSAADLVKELQSSNGWRRDTAHQLLMTKTDPEVHEQLRRMTTGGTRATARVHALSVLDGQKALTSEIVLASLKDPHPGVRRQAVRLAPTAGVSLEVLRPLSADPSAKVRLELACVVGDYDQTAAGEVLADVLLHAFQATSDTNQNSYLVAAVMSSLQPSNVEVLVRRLIDSLPVKTTDAERPPQSLPGMTQDASDALLATLLEQAASMLADKNLFSILDLTLTSRSGTTISGAPQRWQMLGLARILDRMAERGFSPATRLQPESYSLLTSALQQARDRAMNSMFDDSIRAAAVPLFLRTENPTEDWDLLKSLLTPQTPPMVQAAVVGHLGMQTDETVAEILLVGWPSHSPQLRPQILNMLASRASWLTTLATHIESGQVRAQEIDSITRQRLLSSQDSAVVERLRKVFSESGDDDRMAVVKSLQSVLQMPGDKARGATIFGRRCATCHRQNGVGFEVGPNLASLTNRTPETLLTAMLAPSAAVEAKYVNFIAVTTSGRSATGLLHLETGSSITLMGAEAKSEAILRTDIEELRSTGKSLMPDGLEKELSAQDFADVIEFVRSL